MVQMTRIIHIDIVRLTQSHRCKCSQLRRANAPRSRADELIARHARKGLDQRRRKVRHKAKLVGVDAAIIFNCQHGSEDCHKGAQKAQQILAKLFVLLSP